ncbi:CoA transferase subunit A [Geobacter argillaceus]|uniref:Glutaconate CoA-transferase subunit A n=1 Tax=Geobacter argillaceus TaxID=345631 RepID=A0A562WT03_9BACT|nr:CoA-transferase [Geobacter argillaceus]TWJ33431.1 glutaconate CoA-transferase subunit A [Geobacter argillaceus]
MKNKKISIQEAAELVRDGSRLTFAGFTIWRKPFAVAYELIRQQRRNLHLIEVGGGSISDCLIGAGCVGVYESCWVGHELYGKYGANLSRKVKNREIIMEDYSHGEMVFRFAAAAAGMPFAVSQSSLGTDIHNPEYDMLGRAGLRDGIKNARSKYQYMDDPFYNGGKYVLLPAAKADVAVLSVQQVGEEGTVRIKGQYYSDPMVARAADITIAIAEEIVPESYLRRDSHVNTIPSFEVDYIVECPWSAHPSGMFGRYDVDGDFLRNFFQQTRSQEGFDAFAREWIFGLDHDSYLEKLGVSRLQRLRANTALNYSTNRGRGK